MNAAAPDFMRADAGFSLDSLERVVSIPQATLNTRLQTSLTPFLQMSKAEIDSLCQLTTAGSVACKLTDIGIIATRGLGLASVVFNTYQLKSCSVGAQQYHVEGIKKGALLVAASVIPWALNASARVADDSCRHSTHLPLIQQIAAGAGLHLSLQEVGRYQCYFCRIPRSHSTTDSFQSAIGDFVLNRSEYSSDSRFTPSARLKQAVLLHFFEFVAREQGMGVQEKRMLFSNVQHAIRHDPL